MEKINDKLTSDYLAIYQEGINQGLIKNFPVILAMEWFYRAMLTTINYIVKYEPNATVAEQAELAEKRFNNFLYGIRL